MGLAALTPSQHHHHAHMEMQQWPKRPSTSQLQLGSAPKRPPNEENPTPAGPLTSTGAPARPARPSRPSCHRGTHPGPRRLGHHQGPTHQAPAKMVRLSGRDSVTYEHQNDILTPPAHHHRAHPPQTRVVRRLPTRGRASHTGQRQRHARIPTHGRRNPSTPRAGKQRPPKAPQRTGPHRPQYRPAGIIPQPGHGPTRNSTHTVTRQPFPRHPCLPAAPRPRPQPGPWP